MKMMRTALVALTVLGFATAANAAPKPAPAPAPAERVYDQGSVWQMSYIETMPGKFDDYIAYLSNQWRANLEEFKKMGDVLDYKVLALTDPRDGEPDLVLAVEFKNMATLDRSLDEVDAVSAKVFGSVVKSNEKATEREVIRKLRGSVMARELTFKTPPPQ